MYKIYCILILLWSFSINTQAQDSIPEPSKKRLDFAKTYFEGGAAFMPSFTGRRLINNEISSFKHPASLNQYLTWGAFHFWGHAEFYVTFPLMHTAFSKNEETSFQLIHYVTTGAKIYPWAMRKKTLRPYLGFHWGATDFKQIIASEEDPTSLSKDFALNPEFGLSYIHKNFGFRLGFNYFINHKWKYYLNRDISTEIKTPAYSIQLGFYYSFDQTKKSKAENLKTWNNYPSVSRLSFDARKFGDFFLGFGPSSSYSLKASAYNKAQFPYLKSKITSGNYFDIAMGYHFNKIDLFTAISFRNPTFKTSGYGASQVIKKYSFALEINKYLTDYSGFVPYIGINVAYDNLKYQEEVDGNNRTLHFRNKIEPGLTFGWDILPGKTSEVLILRTNLRWYPFSNFSVDGKKFNFSQLEYNLIQVVFYPTRLIKKKQKKI